MISTPYVFPRGNVYPKLRDLLGSVYDDASFAPLFAARGRPAERPWRLALVTVMQFAEGLSDRQAAGAVRARIDWSYALGLELSDPGLNSRSSWSPVSPPWLQRPERPEFGNGVVPRLYRRGVRRLAPLP